MGATIALGSQPCSGMIAALTPKPPMNSPKISSKTPVPASRPKMPVEANDRVPATLNVMAEATSTQAPPVSV